MVWYFYAAETIGSTMTIKTTLFIFIISALAALVAKPELLPKNAQQPFWRIHHGAVGIMQSESKTQAPSEIYPRKTQDGSVVFSTTQKGGATVYTVDKSQSVFISMQSSQTDTSDDENASAGKSGVEAILDPVNSINHEMAENVTKMRAAQREKLAEQGI